MPYARTGPASWEWVPQGVAYFEYTGPTKAPSHTRKPWEVDTPTGAAPKPPVVELGNRPEGELQAVLEAIATQPGLTGQLRKLAREFGTVTSKKFVDIAVQAGVNSHTATKQFRLGRKGVK